MTLRYSRSQAEPCSLIVAYRVGSFLGTGRGINVGFARVLKNSCPSASDPNWVVLPSGIAENVAFELRGALVSAMPRRSS